VEKNKSKSRFFVKNVAVAVVLFTVTVAFLFSGCTKSQNSNTKNSQSFGITPSEGVYYSLFVRSFSDSDNDGTGDFNGITDKLDYLHSLGITGIWLLPIFPSHSYHGYDVDDYYSVNPDYGTMEDFENLILQCNKRKINVMIDITFNHSSKYNDWFIKSKDSNDPHRTWYHWINTPNNTKVWGHKLWNEDSSHPGNYYAGEFDSGMPDFNLENTELRAELKKVLKFWLDKGVSGFRFDAAGHIYDKIKMPEGFVCSTEKSAEFWKEITNYLKSTRSDQYSVAEVWSSTHIRALSLAGLDSVFHFDLGDNYIINSIKNNSAGNNNYAHIVQNDFLSYEKYNQNFIDAPFLTNHDQARVAGLLRSNTANLKLAAGMYILGQGVPFVYYGEEIGMMSGANDESKRTPMLWGDKGETTWASQADCIYNKKTIPVKVQNKDKDSLLNYYRKLINFRNSHQAFVKGKFSPLDTKNEKISSWTMEYSENVSEKAYVYHNLSEEETVISVPENLKIVFSTYEKKTKLKENKLTVPAKCSVVLL